MLLIGLLTLLTAGAPDPPGPLAGMQPYLVAVNVADVDRASKWYEDMLGFTVDRRMDLPEYGLRIHFLRAGSFRLEIQQKAGSAPQSRYSPDVKDDMLIHGLKKLAFRVADVDAAAGFLKSRGVRFDVDVFEDKAMKLRSFIVADPDGNLVQFVQELP